MRNELIVYWIGDAEDGSHEGHATSRITLLLGTQVMEVPGVMFMEYDFESVQGMWEENLAVIQEGGEAAEGHVLRDITAQQANLFHRCRCYVEDEAQGEGEMAYHAGMEADENPYPDSEVDHEEWLTGWSRAYAQEHGEKYDPEEDARMEDERERREYRADLAASRATLGRWFHEEMAAQGG